MHVIHSSHVRARALTRRKASLLLLPTSLASNENLSAAAREKFSGPVYSLISSALPLSPDKVSQTSASVPAPRMSDVCSVSSYLVVFCR